MEDYDVVVVGAGPAGSSAAYAAAKAGARVMVLERESEVAHTVRTSGVTWISDIESFGIPRECYNPIRNYSFCSPANSVTLSSEKPMAAVLDVRKTYRWLAKRAGDAGAIITTGAPVTDVLFDGKRPSGVVAGGKEFCGMIIDASGFGSAVAGRMGLVQKWRRFGAGAEYEVRAQSADPDTWWLMVGAQYSPAGYAWIFPLGNDTVRIGVGVGRPESDADPQTILDHIIKERLGPIKDLGRLDIIETHRGLIPNEGLSRRTVYDNLILVGDSAGQANPLVLEGIRYAIRFGGMAGGVAARASLAGDTSAGVLEEYEKHWRAQIGSKIRSAGKVQQRWLGLSDKQWDEELDIIRKLGPGEFIDFVRADFGVKNTAKLALKHPVMAVRRLFGMVRR